MEPKVRGSSSLGTKHKSDFQGRIRFFNNLPDVPSDPKFLLFPFDPERFVRYSTTSLERNYKSFIHTEPDLGIPIDLINRDIYAIPDVPVPLPDEDLKLLEYTPNKVEKVSKKRKKEPTSHIWLRRTSYITTDGEIIRTEKKKEEEAEQEEKMSREDYLQGIEQTFQMAKVEPKHPTNPNLKPIETWPVFPDMELWPNTYFQVVFDRDPAPESIPKEDKEDFLRDGIIKGYESISGTEKTNIVGYMLPKRKTRDPESSEREYDWIRPYSFDTRKGMDFVGCYFFLFSEDSARFVELGSRVNLSKPKIKITLKPPKFVVLQDDELNEKELEERKVKATALKELEEKEANDFGGVLSSPVHNKSGEEKKESEPSSDAKEEEIQDE